MREMMDKHPGFRDTGKRMLNIWSEGVHRLRDRRMYALPVWPSGEAFAGISGPPKLESLVKVVGKSELMAHHSKKHQKRSKQSGK